MANKTLFTSAPKTAPATAKNHHGAPAYGFSAKHALAQYAMTGCLTSTFYANAQAQLADVLNLCRSVEPEFVAKLAVYCRERGFMKDMPALLTAFLSLRDRDLFTRIFHRVIDNGKMLRNFVQIMRSGAVGRKSLGSAPKRLVREWFSRRDPETLFKSSVGQSPSFVDILKMTHPKPEDRAREAFYGYLIGRAVNADALPDIVRRYEAFKSGDRSFVPDVPLQMLTALDASPELWSAAARTASWQTTRMNLNAFLRHGVFDQKGMTELIAQRLRNEREIERARAFPYQLLAAYLTIDSKIPKAVHGALHDAMEIAIRNVPKVEGKTYVFPDVSGSMASPATGRRPGATSVVRCIDIAALIAAAVLRKNPDACVIPFETSVVNVSLRARDSVMKNAAKLAAIGGGGTNCSAPLAKLNREKAKGDVVIYVSDNESWIDADKSSGRSTATMREWDTFKGRNPKAKLICIDIQPYGSTQAMERGDILNVGGFSDQAFHVMADFAAGRLNPKHWVGEIEATAL
jgi:60 kDa SS-A/Ro ribonucleoprotein